MSKRCDAPGAHLAFHLGEFSVEIASCFRMSFRHCLILPSNKLRTMIAPRLLDLFPSLEHFCKILIFEFCWIPGCCCAVRLVSGNYCHSAALTSDAWHTLTDPKRELRRHATARCCPGGSLVYQL